MTRFVDRPFDWVAGLAFASGAAVILPSMAVLTITVLTVALSLFR